jgi:ABC-type lipoprotein release transport system permease subunit
MYRLFLSFRFLRHHWLMTLIGSFFVGASLIILVVVMAVMDGFQAKLKETIAGSSADLMLTPRWPCDPVALARAVEELVPGVEAAGPYYETITLTRRAGKLDPMYEKMHYAGVFGVDAKREARINRFSEYLATIDDLTHVRRMSATVRDRSDPFKIYDEHEAASGTVGVVMGVGLARDVDVRVGQKIRVAIAVPPKDVPGSNDPVDVSLKYLQVLVVGLYESGNGEIDRSCIFMDHEAFRRMFDDDSTRASIRCRLANPDDFQAKKLIEPVLGELVQRSVRPSGAVVDAAHATLRPESWRDRNRSLVQAIESEKSMILVIAFLIVVAGTSSIFAAQWLLVSDKVREIGILRALGADFNGVVSIFVLNGFLMGVLGSAGGAFGGLLVVRHIDAVHGMLSWALGHKVFDPAVYNFNAIPTQVDYGEVTRYALAALVCTLIASAVPAMRAGFLRPAEALHRD